ncbi:Esterase LipU [Psilocybe cubensis]|uniref:Alpha/beta hydrolase fold-3 domain-containing protein n=2 Tax=Psilocybe cubensis TaxID=181762 RepID=A0A8H8CGT1_PSICU|nr:Esterase LipU [Psilocybe cubensis]KAH9474642.1 Esterase LipU [Psilocybe cubensis]
MTFAYRNQPWKALYLATRTAVLLFQLPFYAIIYIYPGARPRRTWSIGRSLVIFAFRAFIDVLYNTSPTLIGSVRPVEQMTQKEIEEAVEYGFVWVDGAPEFVTGEIKDAALLNEVSPARISGYWYGKRDPYGKAGQRALPNEKVIYHFHGGGFSGTGHPSNIPGKTMFEGLMQFIPGEPRVFALEYRLSSTTPFAKANPFPAALLDAIAGYRYLIHDIGFLPSNIIISGDSAGGLLAFWLAQYISTAKYPDLPNAGGLLLLSPTVDWANTQTGSSSSMVQNKDTDFVDKVLRSGYPCRALLGKISEDEVYQNEWIAPGSIHLCHKPGKHARLPKTCIVAGGAEQTLDSMVTLANRLAYDMGHEKVTFLEAKEGTHDFLLFPLFEFEKIDTLKKIKKWAEEQIWPTV